MMEWIKCSTRMPDSGQECWTCSKDKKVQRCRYIGVGFVVDKLDFESRAYTLEEFENATTTHWMPYYTPEPPKDE